MRQFCLLMFVLSGACQAAEKPIQALLVTGGCCHDYNRQKLILTRGISARANVRWTVVHQGGTTTDTKIPLYEDPHWAEGFDIVVHNECFAHVQDKAFVDNILKPHREGLPAILIHCAMHCYRVGDDRWFEFVGLRSPGHGPHYSYSAINLKPDHPIMQGFGEMFLAPKGELYHTVEIFDTCTPLAQANRQQDKEPQVCIWTNDYLGTRVFGTTIGHYNETMAEPKYLDTVTKGLLWAVGRDPEQDFTPSTAKVDEEIRGLINVDINNAVSATELPQNCCGEENLAFGRPVTSKTEQPNNWRRHLTDGKLNTRWCADGGQVNEWVTVDLEKPEYVRSLRLHWERRQGTAYQYTVESSADNESWKTIVDESQSQEKNGIREHQVDSPDTRYLRVTFLGSSTNGWGSIWELEASEGELPELSKIQVIPEGTPSVSDVETPPGFDVKMFGAPPAVNYPVCLTTAATGEVFVGVDEQGSLGKEPGRGKVLRCIDTDGDGQADKFNVFAKMDHPRGLVYDNGSLWVLHPPYLTLYQDENGDGVADTSEVLIKGISTEEVNKRGADHTTNGIRMGIDGWIYIAVGDYGVVNAVGTDGTTLKRRGGGIIRVRPDGTDMEFFAWGLRNILDVCIDSQLNIFTRDNTNDGGGWDVRVSHILQGAEYGYPSWYANFASEIMPPLGDYGGGSGCGGMFVNNQRWPAQYGNALYTCDWGRSELYRHQLSPEGPTYAPHQEVFLKIPRPTDMDMDASGLMYVSSWKDGSFNYSNPNVGFVAQIRPKNFVPQPFPDVTQLDTAGLQGLLRQDQAIRQLAAQREILRRGKSAEMSQ
ncbi:MAG: discoidin domain-containing protein, partial [Planctomycetaceae bacterium]|nr:discoidin domain-containing protein [Planctomycetaceae bacterium]